MMVNSPFEPNKASHNFSNLFLFSALIILFAIDTAMYHPSLWVFITIAVFWGIVSQIKWYPIRSPQRWLLGGLTVVGLLLVFLHGWAEPSHAILLTDAQTFFVDNLTTADTESQATAVNMIFNVARGLYIFYLIIAVVGAWQTAQRDEDWVPVIKVPVMSLLAIFGLDVMTNLIIA